MQRTQVLGLQSQSDLAKFERLDDVIMGGQSESALKPGPDGTAEWQGVLRVEGGGFCGCRSKVVDPPTAFIGTPVRRCVDMPFVCLLVERQGIRRESISNLAGVTLRMAVSKGPALL